MNQIQSMETQEMKPIIAFEDAIRLLSKWKPTKGDIVWNLGQEDGNSGEEGEILDIEPILNWAYVAFNGDLPDWIPIEFIMLSNSPKSFRKSPSLRRK